MTHKVKRVLGSVRVDHKMPTERELSAIKERWGLIDARITPMIYAGFVKRDMQLLLRHIDILEREIQSKNDDEAGASL